MQKCQGWVGPFHEWTKRAKMKRGYAHIYNKNLKPTFFYHEKKNENFTVRKGKPDKHY